MLTPRRTADLLVLFDAFLIMLFIFMAAAHESGSRAVAEVEQRLEAAGRRQQSAEARNRDLARKLEDSKATLETEARRARLAEEAQELVLDNLVHVLGDPELQQRLQQAIERGLSDPESRRRMSEALAEAADPDTVIEVLLKLSRLDSMYATVRIRLTARDTLQIADGPPVARESPAGLKEEIDRYLDDYRRERQGVERFLFVVRYGDCTEGFMRRWREALSLLQREGRSVIATPPFYDPQKS